MALEIVTDDTNTDKSAMKSADEVFGYCASLAMAHPMGQQVLVAIKEAQRRLRRRTNPEMFGADGSYCDSYEAAQ